MASNFTVFQSAISALAANSNAISIASNNIANVNTPGFSRQEAVIASRRPQTIGGLELGLGVVVKKTRNIVDSFAELRLANAASDKFESDSLATNSQQLEKLFNESSQEGLASFMTSFFGAFQDVASDPTGIGARVNLLSRATFVTDRFHNLSQSLKDSRVLIDGDIRNKVNQVNTLAEEIVDLNGKIQVANNQALSLRDERTLKVRQLAELIDAKGIENSDGTFQVYIASSLQLVTGQTRATVTAQSDVNNGGLSKILFSTGSGSSYDMTSRVQGGSLKGLLTVRDTNIPAYQDHFNELAYEFATKINALHVTGYNLNGGTGVNFFQDLTDSATTTDLATDLRTTNGTTLGIESGDTITIGGNLGGAFSTTLSVSSTTTLQDIASALQTALRAAGDNTELAVVQPDGSIQVTSGAGAITGLTLSISGNSTFNSAFTFSTPIAGGGSTGSSSALGVESSDAASNIDLDPAVDGNPDAIASSDTAANLPGGNGVALALGNLQTTNIAFQTGNATFAAFYGDLLARIGNDSASARNTAEFSADIFDQAEIQRESVSGVSIEEEQLNLLRFQAAFQAASKLVSVADQVLSTLVQIV